MNKLIFILTVSFSMLATTTIHADGFSYGKQTYEGINEHGHCILVLEFQGSQVRGATYEQKEKVKKFEGIIPLERSFWGGLVGELPQRVRFNPNSFIPDPPKPAVVAIADAAFSIHELRIYPSLEKPSVISLRSTKHSFTSWIVSSEELVVCGDLVLVESIQNK